MADNGAKEVDLDGEPQVSKKALKKAEKALAKEAKKAATATAVPATPDTLANDIEKDFFGTLPLCQSAGKTGRQWVEIKDIDERIKDKGIWIRCRIQESRCKGALGFLQLRQRTATIQGVMDSKDPNLGRAGVKWAGTIPLESIVDVHGVVVKPEVEVTSTTQKVELQILKLFCVSKAPSELPFQLKDANRPDSDGSAASVVNQDTRLDNRILDLRNFVEIHTPKLLSGASEGGSTVFTLNYFGRQACLAQSPQLHKQMALCADMDRVFEITPVFRAENSNTYRHLCEFTGLDIEMTIKEHYDEVLDMLDNTFQYMFEGLTKHCEKEIQLIRQQHEALPFKWLKRAPRLDYSEGIQMLRDSGAEGIPDDISEFDLSTELEKRLGHIISEKYKTDFYMLVRYPLKIRPFYTMPSADDPTLSNSYDFFMRGEEILSGAQRVHDPQMLVERAKAWNIPIDSLQSYISAFDLGAFPHGGCGIGLERVVMLFLGLGNIRKTSMFPRDPKRLAP